MTSAIRAYVVYKIGNKEADINYEQINLRIQPRQQRQQDSVLEEQLNEYCNASRTVIQPLHEDKQNILLSSS